MKNTLLIIISILLFFGCKKARGLETNKEKKEFYESVEGDWKLYFYEYDRSVFNIDGMDDIYISERMTGDTILRQENNTHSKYFADYKLHITNLHRWKVSHYSEIRKDMITPTNSPYFKVTHLINDWSELENGKYYLTFQGNKLELRKYRDELELYLEFNYGEWLVSTNRARIKYVFKRI